MEERKVCVSCGKDLILADDFYDHPNPRDGKEGICKACKRQKAKLNYEKKRKSVEPPSRKDRPRAFSFSPVTLAEIESVTADLGLATFSETINTILNTALTEKRYLTSNAFSKALSTLDKNLFELSVIFKNLNQLSHSLTNTKTSDNASLAKALSALTEKHIRLTTKLINLTRDIATTAP